MCHFARGVLVDSFPSATWLPVMALQLQLVAFDPMIQRVRPQAAASMQLRITECQSTARVGGTRTYREQGSGAQTQVDRDQIRVLGLLFSLETEKKRTRELLRIAMYRAR